MTIYRPFDVKDIQNDQDYQNPAFPMDAFIKTSLARATGGMSVLSLMTAMFDWGAHMAAAPAQQMHLGWKASRIGLNALAAAAEQPGPSAPFVFARSAFENTLQLIDEAANAPTGVSHHHTEKVRFASRLTCEAFHPNNFLWTNEEALTTTVENAGANLMRGWKNAFEDFASKAGRGAPNPAEKAVGKTLAVTPGRVVYRNELIELIQYEPAGETLRPEPILVTPAWIMKYYILDLSPHNSLVKYLVEQGFRVFMISWRNPDRGDRDLSFDDYRKLGVLSALDAITAIRPNAKIHAVGYCLGGTLLSITAAALSRDGDKRIASLTLLAAQTDFRDPGELSLFIDESQLDLLDASMQEAGYLDAEQMSGAFTMLRSRNLVWRRMQKAYYLGERDELIDLMIWNGDTTRMPFKMHSEYLRRLFLNNDFVQGRFNVDGRPVAVSDMRAPIFALGTMKDHVAPWRSVFKIMLFADAEVTFALTSGGHNAGIVSEPGHPRRHHYIHTKQDEDHFLSPDAWLELAEDREGSWWPSWASWLHARSGAFEKASAPVRANVPSNSLCPENSLPAAPGAYVFNGNGDKKAE